MKNKNDMLWVGAGQCGNNFIDSLLDLDSKYNGLYINTSIRDVQGLKHANLNRNVYLIPNSDGAGRNRSVGLGYVKENVANMVDIIAGYIQQTDIMLVSSMGGGSGSAIVPALIRLISKTLPNKKIHVIAIKPSLDEQTDVLENAISYWNDVLSVVDKITTLSIVDNDKRKNKLNINDEWAKITNKSFNMSSSSKEGSFDSADLSLMMEAQGYKVIYELDSTGKYDENTAYNKAVEDSIFFEAPSNRCAYLGTSLIKNTYEGRHLAEIFKISDANQNGVSEDSNIILLTGCEIPKLAAELMVEELEDRKKSSVKRVVNKQELMINVDKKSPKKQEVEEVTKVEVVSNKALIDDDDDFWGDAF